ncbi:small ribosomal subunit protein mS43 [Diutina catenulata]
MFKTAVRGLHYRLPTIGALKSSSEPFPGLYSSKTVGQLWFDRGQTLIDSLNAALESGPVSANDDVPLHTLIAQTMQKPEAASICHGASLLYNSQFFFESLKPSEPRWAVEKADYNALFETPTSSYGNVPADEGLHKWIVDSFGSMDEFRTLFLNAAHAIKGDGYTWLAAAANHPAADALDAADARYMKLVVVNTFGTGVVDDGSRAGQLHKAQAASAQKEAALKQQQQERSQQNEFDDEAAALAAETPAERKLELGTVDQAEQADGTYASRRLVPLMCIDASPRAYLGDYGVFGKQHYLDNVWECLDWAVAAKRMPQRDTSALMK